MASDVVANHWMKKHGIVAKVGIWIGEAYLPLLTGVFFFALWEALIHLLEVPRYILPAPSAVLLEFAQHFRLIWYHTLVTANETFVGYAIAIVLGIPLSIFVAFSETLQRTFYAAAVTLGMVPTIAFAPLFVVWFGFSFASKMLVVFWVCFFPILINGIFGFLSLSDELRQFSLSTGADRVTTFWKIRLPAALPQVFVGLKGAAINATVGATIAEWIGGNAGLGYYIQVATGDFNMRLALAAIIMLTALGLLLYFLVILAEMKLIPWHESQRESR
ncbi:MAG: ABC transporter permease [Desulfobacteraceae bacterium]|mgnify:FL=1|jgi:NitT/TauT family transport system permease protein|nr:ABC transporter permease [Desulfobacteraceae bacterium]